MLSTAWSLRCIPITVRSLGRWARALHRITPFFPWEISKMRENQSQPASVRKPYVPPAVERVVLDPIKEMLESCPTALDGKAPGTCNSTFS